MVSVILGLLLNPIGGAYSHRDSLKPFAKPHVHMYHTSNFKTIRAVFTEN